MNGRGDMPVEQALALVEEIDRLRAEGHTVIDTMEDDARDAIRRADTCIDQEAR